LSEYKVVFNDNSSVTILADEYRLDENHYLFFDTPEEGSRTTRVKFQAAERETKWVKLLEDDAKAAKDREGTRATN
jgi:hypothetical protein